MSEDTSAWAFLFFMIFVIFLVIFVVGNVAVSYETRYITVESEIENVDTVLDDDGGIDYLFVSFANNESYKINVYKDIDLTVNSKLIIELRQLYVRTFFWEDFEPYDDVYSIGTIVKVPDGDN